MIIKKALYGLKTSGAAFRAQHLAETLYELNYSPTKADPDVWIRPGIKLLSCDIQNAYLTADCHKRIYCFAGPEFGSEQDPS
jgi:hypothetical protein